jgi:hypothetical protein
MAGKTKKPNAPEPVAVAEPEPKRPNWWEGTPGECDEYELVMWRDAGAKQAVYMSRGEYITLKRHLAELRGLQFTDREYEREEVHA